MNRRGFIQSFIGAVAMAATGKAVSDDGVALNSIAHAGSKSLEDMVIDLAEESGEVGFGLAPAKMEGASIPYDRLNCRDIGKQLAEGLNKAFGEVYGELDPDNLEELWIDIDDVG